jgi:hypothetical protein
MHDEAVLKMLLEVTVLRGKVREMRGDVPNSYTELANTLYVRMMNHKA